MVNDQMVNRFMKFIGIIPARYASTRFPGKPLAEICGKTVIRRMKVPVMLRLDNPSAYEVYAVDTSGARLGKVKTEVKSNRLMFVANTEFSSGTGAVVWEIVICESGR